MKKCMLNKKALIFVIPLLMTGGCKTNPVSNSSNNNEGINPEENPTKISSSLFNKMINEELKIDLNEKSLESKSYRPIGLPVVTISAALKETILSHEQTMPTQFSQKKNVLAKCRLIGTRIELDNLQQTAEWLVTPDNHCPSQSPNKVKTYWIVQSAQNGKTSVLIADRGKTLSVWKKDKASLRFIMTDIEITKPDKFTRMPVPVMCHKSWTFKSGEYVSKYAGVEVYKSDRMLPYNQWTPVSGTDSLTNIDENFQCPAR